MKSGLNCRVCKCCGQDENHVKFEKRCQLCEVCVSENCCRKCKEVKADFEQMSSCHRYRGGVYSWCRKCRREYNKERTKRPGPTRERRLLDKRERRFKERYGITIADFDRMLAEQKGCCKLCGEEFTEKFSARVDHCHQTGVVRGLLHGPCNSMLGQAHDDVSKLQKAIEYLENFRKGVICHEDCNRQSTNNVP